jgi:hypothetical protein
VTRMNHCEVSYPMSFTTKLILSEIAAGLGLSLTQAARRMPSSRGGRPVHSSCIFRWVTDGVRLSDGTILRLEAAKLAGRWLTSAPAIERFLAAQTPAIDQQTPTAPRTPGQRSKASEKAARELEALGI